MDSFHIDYLKIKDANQLFEFLVANTERFKRFFPVTIASNSTLKQKNIFQ